MADDSRAPPEGAASSSGTGARGVVEGWQEEPRRAMPKEGSAKRRRGERGQTIEAPPSDRDNRHYQHSVDINECQGERGTIRGQTTAPLRCWANTSSDAYRAPASASPRDVTSPFGPESCNGSDSD